MDNFPRGRPPRGTALSPVESHLLRTMDRVARYPVKGEPDVLVHTGLWWKTRRTIERDFALELDSRGNVVRRREPTESDRRKVSRGLRHFVKLGIILKKKTKDRGVLFGIKGLVVEAPPGGWDIVEDFLLSGVGIRGTDLRVVLPSSTPDE